jgi:hypothetical protein
MDVFDSEDLRVGCIHIVAHDKTKPSNLLIIIIIIIIVINRSSQCIDTDVRSNLLDLIFSDLPDIY